jgi:hypothetical protein
MHRGTTQSSADTTTCVMRGSVQHRADASRMVDPNVGLCITDLNTEPKWASQGDSVSREAASDENRLGTAMRTFARTGQSQKVSRQARRRVLRQFRLRNRQTADFVS